MQCELHDLQPQLVVASANTEKLMVKIEQDTVVVEKQKEVIVQTNDSYFIKNIFLFICIASS